MIRTFVRGAFGVALLATPALAQNAGALASAQASQMNVCANYRSVNNDIQTLNNELAIARATLGRIESGGADPSAVSAARGRVEELSNRYMFYQRSLQTIIGQYYSLAGTIAANGGSNACSL